MFLFRRDYYRNSGGSERPRYPRDDNIQKIPRLSKKNPPRPSPTVGPLREATEKGSTDQVSNILFTFWGDNYVSSSTF